MKVTWSAEQGKIYLCLGLAFKSNLDLPSHIKCFFFGKNYNWFFIAFFFSKIFLKLKLFYKKYYQMDSYNALDNNFKKYF